MIRVFYQEGIYTFYTKIHGVVNLSYLRQVKDYFLRFKLGKYIIKEIK